MRLTIYRGARLFNEASELPHIPYSILPQLPVLHLCSASLKMSMPVKIGQWGGAGGKPCDIKYTPHALTRVKVRSGDYVDAIGFTCVDTSGNLHVEEWGGSGGKTHEFVLGDSEYLKEISGTYDEALRSLKFVTNTGQVFEYGNATGAYSFDVPLINAKITGFLGRTGNYIDAIGVYVLPA